MFKQDIMKFEKLALKYINVELKQNELDAVVSIIFQRGPCGANSKQLYKLVNKCELAKATELIKNTGDKKSSREAESVLFSKSIYLPSQYYQEKSYYKAVFKKDYERLKKTVNY